MRFLHQEAGEHLLMFHCIWPELSWCLLLKLLLIHPHKDI